MNTVSSITRFPFNLSVWVYPVKDRRHPEQKTSRHLWHYESSLFTWHRLRGQMTAHSQYPNWQFLFIINFEWEKVFCLFKWFNYQLARRCHQMMTWWSEVLLNIQVTHTFYPHLSLTWVPLTRVSAPLRVSSTEHGASDHVLGVHWGAHTLCVTQHTHIHSLQIFEAIEHCMCLLLLLTWRTSEVGPLE